MEIPSPPPRFHHSSYLGFLIPCKDPPFHATSGGWTGRGKAGSCPIQASCHPPATAGFLRSCCAHAAGNDRRGATAYRGAAADHISHTWVVAAAMSTTCAKRTTSTDDSARWSWISACRHSHPVAIPTNHRAAGALIGQLPLSAL